MFKQLAAIFWLLPVVAFAQGTIGGDWLITQDVYGNPLHQRLTLKVDGTTISGTLGRRAIEGTVTGTAVRFVVKGQDASEEFLGTLSGDAMSGTMTRTN